MDSRAGWRIAIVADDLTGACDAAVPFAAAGLKTFVGLRLGDGPPAGWQAFAVNMDTRCSAPQEAADRAGRALAQSWELHPARIVKKIDSMLRGNVAVELEAARAALAPAAILMAPAFPALGRTVKAGWIEIAGETAGIRIAGRLPELSCANIEAGDARALAARFARAIASGADVLIPDTASERDLLEVVQAAAAVENLLWTGSGGLTRAIASALGSSSAARISLATTAKPWLLCAGSDHSATLAQLRALEMRGEAVLAQAGAEGYLQANAALLQGRTAALRFTRDQLNTTALQSFAAAIHLARCGGLILTGGDTAMCILEALGAGGIRLHGEVLPGIPQGRILGGSADGLLLVTKSGAFGGPDALLRCVEILREPPATAEMRSEEAIQ